jgi:Zn-dependent protease
MSEILFILFTLALLILSQLIRPLLVKRIPGELRLKPTKLKHAPDIMADLFVQVDQPLRDLGFSRGYWASVQTSPALPGVSVPLICLYHHKEKPVIARVSPPHTVFSADRCQVTFLSISRKKTFLVTSDQGPELFPPPSRDRAIILNTRGDSVSEQFSAHVRAMSRLGMKWLDRSSERGEATWLFRLANRYEAKSIQWLDENRYVKYLADGSRIPKIRVVLDFIRRLALRRVRNQPLERTAIPLNRAAYLFMNWRKASFLPPPVSTQLGYFLGITLVFVLLVGLFGDWLIALLLPVVIGLHELGHWLTMRLLGYRYLQLQILPLVGGIALDHKTRHKAEHRILVSLMGPLPGLFLGSIILLFNGMEGGLVSKLGIMLLVVNYLTLLPIMPLDGGQLLKALVSVRRYGVLIALECLGFVILLLLGWLSDSLFLGVLGLLPLFSVLMLLRRRRVLDTLEGATDGIESPSSHKTVAAVIQAIDETDRSYRPLKKKLREIVEILSTLEIKRVTPAAAKKFLAFYLATIVLPLVVVFAASPGIDGIRTALFSDIEDIQQTAQHSTESSAMSQLVIALADRYRNILDPHLSQGERDIVRPPVTHKSITQAETRLGIKFDRAHLEFLETSNGFVSQLSSTDGKDYLIYPAEEVVRFAQKLPQIVNSLLSANSSGTRNDVMIKEASDSIETQGEVYDLNQLAPMLLIGNPHKGNYLLLDTEPETAKPSLLYVIYETPGGLEGRRFKSLRHYLTYHLSMIESARL